MAVSIEPFPLAPDDFASVAGGETPNAFLNADSRVGVVAGKTSLTVAQAASQLLRGEPGWSSQLLESATVTYAYRASAATMPADAAGFSTFSAVQIAQTEKALTAWSDVANIKFVRVGAGTSGPEAYSNDAAILFGNYSSGQEGAAAFAYYPGNAASTSRSGDVWVNVSLGYNANPTATNYGGMVLAHELGHAIGLAHPSEYDAEANTTLTYAANASYYEDSRQYTVMSYFSEANTGGAFSGAYASVPLLDDIAAAQLAYGANMSTRTGDTVYGFNSTAGRDWFSATTNATSRLVAAIWDAGGTDTLDFSGYRVAQTIDLRPGYFSSVGGLTGNIAIAMGATIENAIGGTAADVINGNAAANRITGGQGGDTLDGGQGADAAVFSGRAANYAITALSTGGWQVRDNVGTDGTDVVLNVESLIFSDKAVSLVDSRVASAMSSLLRLTPLSASAESLAKSLAADMAAGGTYSNAVAQVIKTADSTTSVAVLSYQFFTGRTPGSAGMDYLIAPDGPNPNNLNSAYYQAFDYGNRYINFAVNLGKVGEGASAFAAGYGALSLTEATRKAYAAIFGLTPTDQKLRDLLDVSFTLSGQTMTRGEYLAYYGGDGLNGQGTKAAMVGWLLAEAAKADVGVYAKSLAAFYADELTRDVFGVDLIGVYAKPEYNLT